MLRMLCPQIYMAAVSDLTPEFLTGRGIKGIILDLDNTILPWKAKKLAAEEVALVKRLQEQGFKICVVSNARHRRVISLLEPLNIPAISLARKPRRTPFRKALAILGTTASETAVVGDQIFTDVLGGNRLGMYTILVTPVSHQEFIGTKLVRLLEKRVLKRMVRRGMLQMKYL